MSEIEPVDCICLVKGQKHMVTALAVGFVGNTVAMDVRLLDTNNNEVAMNDEDRKIAEYAICKEMRKRAIERSYSSPFQPQAI
ncbi:MAG: hypothetical protein OQK12_09865 [Motiliproteus sp.]|nr:hypothetical protein [Motiliproteus sp.]MCW9051265.1 hypothetical protein [Motiliproteus sp.]